MPNLLLTWQQSLVLAGLLLLAFAGVARLAALRPRVQLVADLLRESSLIAALYTLWQFGGSQSSALRTGDAIARAHDLERWQQWLHLPNERHVQEVILGHDLIVRAANLYYATMHFTMMFVFLGWLFVRHRDRYPSIRTVLALSTLGCLLVQFVAVAPPRMLPGYVDTAEVFGQSVYNAGLTVDQLSAMPSVHVLWAVLIGWYALRVTSSPWRLLAPLHAVVTIFVVVATGNHWWLDGVVAVLILMAAASSRAVWERTRDGVRNDGRSLSSAVH